MWTVSGIPFWRERMTTTWQHTMGRVTTPFINAAARDGVVREARILTLAEAAVNEMIDNGEIFTSSWMPGSDWGGTAFQPIWEKAAKKNEDLGAKIFGLLVFDVFRQRPCDGGHC